MAYKPVSAQFLALRALWKTWNKAKEERNKITPAARDREKRIEKADEKVAKAEDKVTKALER